MNLPLGPTWVAALLLALFVVVLVQIVLFAVRRAHAAAVASLEAEGILRRSGRVRIRLALRHYVGPQVRRGGGFSIRTGELILTGKGLVLVAPYALRLGAPPWNALTAEVREGKVYLQTDQPPDATGAVEVTVNAPEPEAWVAAVSRSSAR